jgi:hypothetical protein
MSLPFQGPAFRFLDQHSYVERSSFSSIPQRLPVLQHIFHPRPRFFSRQQLHEILALQIKQPLFVHQAARFHITAAHDLDDAAADVVVVFKVQAIFGPTQTFSHLLSLPPFASPHRA